MINITSKEQCCGCEACVQVCPKACIAMVQDCEGFLYPKADSSICIECGLCEKVCLVINQGEPNQPFKVYTSKNNNSTVREKSSSGGIFTPLAEKIINNGGVVFGSRFTPQWQVEHSFAEIIEELAQFRGSKYVQSRVGDSYLKAKEFLEVGRKVLFTGTPCQIAGLKKFLRKEYENLYTVDIICHGVPSPMVWKQYIDELLATFKNKNIYNIEFRNKDKGWKVFNVKVSTKTEVLYQKSHSEDAYMLGFLRNIYLRPSCHSCPAKSFKNGSDITLGDFWSIQNFLPHFDDDKGVSLVTVNSSKGVDLFATVDAESVEMPQTSLQNMIFLSCKAHHKREQFFVDIKQQKVEKVIKRYTKLPITQQLRVFASRVYHKILRILCPKK